MAITKKEKNTISNEAHQYQLGYIRGLKESKEDMEKMIAGEMLKMQINIDVTRGNGTGNEKLTMVEYRKLFYNIINNLKTK